MEIIANQSNYQQSNKIQLKKGKEKKLNSIWCYFEELIEHDDKFLEQNKILNQPVKLNSLMLLLIELIFLHFIFLFYFLQSLPSIIWLFLEGSFVNPSNFLFIVQIW